MSWQKRHDSLTLTRLVAERREMIAARLAQYRAEHPGPDGRPMTQERASEKAGVAVRQWQRWESGETTPHLKKLQAVAKKLKIPMSEFLPAEAERNNNNHSEATPPSVEQRLEAMQREIERLTEYVRRAIPPSE
jgi:transcriptional regulator with XRE-family HTH domain